MSLPQIIILNGCSSSGKTSIAKLLQEKLPQQYLNFSIDSVLYALPASDLGKMQRGETITRAGYDWPSLVRGYHYCLPALLQAGCQLIIDNAWCDRNEKRELLTELAGYSVALIGVYCDVAVASEREQTRGDRAQGSAAWETPLVHQDMTYDFCLDSTGISPERLSDNALQEILSRTNWHGAIETLENLNMLA